jgi:hypothetical protein
MGVAEIKAVDPHAPIVGLAGRADAVPILVRE